MFRLFRLLVVLAILPSAQGASAGNAQLTKADIPSNLSPEVRRLVAQTFSEGVHERTRSKGTGRDARAGRCRRTVPDPPVA
jgi:hypothetical protein